MNILLTSAGRRSYIVHYFKEALKSEGKVFVANSEYTIAMEDADGYLITPLIYSDEYIPTLIDFCKANNISAIVSLFDIDLLVQAKNRRLFDEIGVKLISADKEFIRICNDKWSSFEFFKRMDIKTPKTYDSKRDVLKALHNGDLKFPVIVKPRWGMGSLAVFEAEAEKELSFYSTIVQKIISTSYLKYESELTKGSKIIYQEKIIGKEYGLDILNDLNGKYIRTFAKHKIAMRSGETDLGETVISAPFEKIAKKIAHESKHEGILSMDCIQNESGIYALEMNCRISGHYPLSHLAGFNYPQVLIDWLKGKHVKKSQFNYKEGLLITKDLVPKILTGHK
jgi:carbamoyl-phosphate synthase large subunit